MFYPSGNRDDRVFTDPHTFDVSRTPNKHVGFGGGGPHFCLGNMNGVCHPAVGPDRAYGLVL